MSRNGTLGFLCLSVLALSVGVQAKADDTVEFNRDIRPILRENCFRCHGPDSAARKAELRLDQREAAVKSDAIVPGDPTASGIIERIISDDPEEVMPPPGTHKVLTAKEKDLLKRWVASGAEYQTHWAFLAPKKGEPPATGVKDATWSQNPIDRFILAKMTEKGFKHGPEADRRTLARRVSLDLTGLPPVPAEVDALVADTSADAYEKYVDRLLASPAWGEHRGRYWLDTARYADTHGIHFDNQRDMWSYREWVIKALNANMPFDQFTIEQLAGDLLPKRTLDQQIASGFNRCNITTNEGGAINEEYLVLYTRDRTETVSQTFLGLTTGCAVCHDHKFDPISQKEFYELCRLLQQLDPGRDGRQHQGDAADRLRPRSPADRPRWDTLVGEVASRKETYDKHKESARPGFDKWLAAAIASPDR